MENNSVKIIIKNVASSPQKARLVADVIRGQKVNVAIDKVTFLNKKAALFFKKALQSAVASASAAGLNAEDLIVKSVSVDAGSKQRKLKFASRGRSKILVKRKSHINLELGKK